MVIRETTTYIEELFRSDIAGTVHSVYERTINLLFNDQLIALQVECSPVSPISIILPVDARGMDAIDATQGDNCHIKNSTLHLGSITIEIDDPTYIFDPNLHPAATDISTIAYRAKSMIERSERSGFARIVCQDPAVDSDLILSMAQKRMSAARDLFLSGKIAEAAAEIIRVIGLGQGLTPSGDDFICGVLAAVKATCPADMTFRLELEKQARIHCMDTNDISATFIRCAEAGMFSRPVLTLFNAPDTEGLLDGFLAVGHSSGIDTLCGIHWIMDPVYGCGIR